MPKTMLIEATHEEEVRVAIVENNRLVDFDYENVKNKSLKGNIYLGKIVRIEPSLQAAFVEYGGNRHGFLPFSEIHPDYFRIPVEDRSVAPSAEGVLDSNVENASTASETGSSDADVPDSHDQYEETSVTSSVEGAAVPPKKYKIQEVLHSRQVILVQVTKEERGNKGAALTSYIALAGRYCVLMPNSSNTGGVSRKITDTGDRRRLTNLIQEFELPEGMALIVRTSGMDRSKTEVRRDFNLLMTLWAEIREATINAIAPALIYEEADLVRRAIRDLYGRDTDEVLVEGKETYRMAKAFMRKTMPSHAKRVQLYKDETTPLFFKYSIERQIEEIFHTKVRLKSGGSLVIHPTEALVSIDVNSGRATQERHIDSTAFKTNLEAAEEVARQVRLRDLAGLVVIDFIDMSDPKHNHAVEKRLKEGLAEDRARTQVGRISMLGLLEFSRQRLRPSLVERSSKICADCHGMGVIRSTVSIILQLFRVLGETCLVTKPKQLNVLVPADVGFYLLNEKRSELVTIEEKYRVHITLKQDDQYKGGFSVRDEENGLIYDTFSLAEGDSTQGKSGKKTKTDKSSNTGKHRKKDGKSIEHKKRPGETKKGKTISDKETVDMERTHKQTTEAKDESREEKTGHRRKGRRGSRCFKEERVQEGTIVAEDVPDNSEIQHQARPDYRGAPSSSYDTKHTQDEGKLLQSQESDPTPAKIVESVAKHRSRKSRTKQSENKQSANDGNSRASSPTLLSEAPHRTGKKGWWKRLLDT